MKIQLSVPEVIFFFNLNTDLGTWFVTLQVALKTGPGPISSGSFILFLAHNCVFSAGQWLHCGEVLSREYK